MPGQRQRQGELLDGEGTGDPDLGQRGDDVGVDVEVAEQRAVGSDRRAAQLLDLLLELLGRGGTGLGALQLGSGRGGVDGGVLGGGQFSRLGLVGDQDASPVPELRELWRCLAALAGPGVGSGIVRSKRRRGQQTGCRVQTARETALGGPASRRSSGHQRTGTCME
jgi:hypothetical protein